MSNHSEEKISPSFAYQRRDEEQRERLFELLSHDHFEAVEGLPYLSRVGFEKWHNTEQNRVEQWFGEPSIPGNPALELSKILNAKNPDRQAGIKWLEANRDKITADMLMQLVSDTRIVAVAHSSQESALPRVIAASKKLKALGWRWLQFEAGIAGVAGGRKHTKYSAAPYLAEEFKLSERRIREVYLAKIELNTDVFPNGADAARRELGLMP